MKGERDTFTSFTKNFLLCELRVKMRRPALLEKPKENIGRKMLLSPSCVPLGMQYK